jgi:hypothetical protein
MKMLSKAYNALGKLPVRSAENIERNIEGQVLHRALECTMQDLTPKANCTNSHYRCGLGFNFHVVLSLLSNSQGSYDHRSNL